MKPDAALVNRLVNMPEMLSALAPGYASVDMSGFFEHPGNIALGDSQGVALFGLLAPGVYQGHYLFPVTVRGSRALRRSREFLAEMFTRYGATTIVGETPTGHLPARIFSRALGFAPRGHSVTQSGRSCVVFILERETWAKSLAASSGASGAS